MRRVAILTPKEVASLGINFRLKVGRFAILYKYKNYKRV
jgi:hypothetical protein